MPETVGTLASTDHSVEEVGGHVVGGMSPNYRIKKDTHETFRQTQDELAREIGVSSRTVTADVLVMSMLRVCRADEDYPHGLLAAEVRAELARRRGLS